MQQNNGTWIGCCFFSASFQLALVIVWRFSLTSSLPALACKNAKKNPIMQAIVKLVENRSKKEDLMKRRGFFH